MMIYNGWGFIWTPPKPLIWIPHFRGRDGGERGREGGPNEWLWDRGARGGERGWVGARGGREGARESEEILSWDTTL